MIVKAISRLARPILARGAATCPWKNMDNYYNYEFTSKPKFIEQTERHPLFRVIDLEGNVIAPEYELLDKDFLTKALETMIFSREMDEVYNNAQRQNRITFYMKTTYQEAESIGVVSGIEPQDTLFLQYRDFLLHMHRGASALTVLNNLKGNKNDLNLGKCMPLTMFNVEKNIFPTSAPLGNRNTQSVGAGYLYRVKGEDRVAMCFFGEGAASEGDFHAGINFASTLGSQTLYICRNNCHAISTFREDQYAGDGIAARGLGYGVPAIKVDGNDLLAVYAATKRARALVIERKGPVLVETYSYRGGDHSTSDSAASYRTKERMEILDKYLKLIGDPLPRLTKYMEKKGYLKDSAAWMKKVAEKARAECLSNLKKIDEIKMANYNNMFTDVYGNEHWNIKEQREELSTLIKKYPEAYPTQEYP